MNKVVFRNCDEKSEYWVALEKLFQTEWSDFLFVDTYGNCCSQREPSYWWSRLFALYRTSWWLRSYLG